MKMNFKYILLILVFSLSICSDQIPGKVQPQSIILKNGTIHTVSGETFIGDLKFLDGKITQIDTDINQNSLSDEIIDLSGAHWKTELAQAKSCM